MTQNEFEQMFKELIDEVLNKDESNILDLRYGLTCSPSSIKKLEKSLGVPASQIRKLEKAALDKLCAAKKLNIISSKLKGVDLDRFATNGLSGYYLLALQIFNH